MKKTALFLAVAGILVGLESAYAKTYLYSFGRMEARVVLDDQLRQEDYLFVFFPNGTQPNLEILGNHETGIPDRIDSDSLPGTVFAFSRAGRDWLNQEILNGINAGSLIGTLVREVSSTQLPVQNLPVSNSRIPEKGSVLDLFADWTLGSLPGQNRVAQYVVFKHQLSRRLPEHLISRFAKAVGFPEEKIVVGLYFGDVLAWMRSHSGRVKSLDELVEETREILQGLSDPASNELRVSKKSYNANAQGILRKWYQGGYHQQQDQVAARLQFKTELFASVSENVLQALVEMINVRLTLIQESSFIEGNFFPQAFLGGQLDLRGVASELDQAGYVRILTRTRVQIPEDQARFIALMHQSLVWLGEVDYN